MAISAEEIGLTGDLYTAGEPAPAGRYRRVDAPRPDFELPPGGRLPASFDGQVALYVRLPVESELARLS